MALDKDRLADAIVDGIATEFGFVWTAPQRTNARRVWKVVATAIIDELDVNATIRLLAADITVPAAGLTAPVGGGPVTGTASIAAAVLTGKLE
jgi:hypothetical protein